jgi:hypothetical protein
MSGDTVDCFEHHGYPFCSFKLDSGVLFLFPSRLLCRTLVQCLYFVLFCTFVLPTHVCVLVK